MENGISQKESILPIDFMSYLKMVFEPNSSTESGL